MQIHVFYHLNLFQANTVNKVNIGLIVLLNLAPIDSLLCKLNTGELGYDGPLYDRFLHMTDNMLGPSPMHIKYSSSVYDGFCI